MADVSSTVTWLIMANLTPRGRLSRRAFFLLSALWVAGFTVLMLIWNRAPPRTVDRILLLWATMLCFWPLFTVAARRLHDGGLSAWLAAPHLFPLAIFVITQLASPFWPWILAWLFNHNLAGKDEAAILWGMKLSLGYVALALVILSILPGQRLLNRYGSPPGKPPVAPDVF